MQYLWLSGTNLPAVLKVECHGMKRADNILAFFFFLLSFLSYFLLPILVFNFLGNTKEKRKKVKSERSEKEKRITFEGGGKPSHKPFEIIVIPIVSAFFGRMDVRRKQNQGPYRGEKKRGHEELHNSMNAHT